MSGIDKLLNYIIQNEDNLVRASGVQDTSSYNNRLKNNTGLSCNELACTDEDLSDRSEMVNDSSGITADLPIYGETSSEDEVPEHIKEMNIQVMLEQLIKEGLVTEYEIDGETYYRVNK